MGNYPRVQAHTLSVDYDADYYDATHGRLLVGMDGDGNLTGWPDQVWTSATSALDLDTSNLDVVFGFWAKIEHNGSTVTPVAGGLIATGDFDGTWTNLSMPEGHAAIPVVNLLDSSDLREVGYGYNPGVNLLEFGYKEEADETTPLALGGANIGVILSEVYDPLLKQYITVTDYGSDFSGDGAAKMDAYAMPEPATLSMLALGGLVLAWSRKRRSAL